MRCIKILLDRLLAGIALIVLSPILVVAAVGIKLSSKGPILYKAQRMGKNMEPYVMFKFRTMRVDSDKEGAITAVQDNRVFPWGNILRKTKIDELPQLINVLEGTMSIVGPRPEDEGIVNKYYSEEEKKTLKVLPGLASPGSIFNYTHGESFLEGDDAETAYVSNLLHVKLALDIYYLEHWSLLYDIKIILRTLYAILSTSFTAKELDYPIEYKRVFMK